MRPCGHVEYNAGSLKIFHGDPAELSRAVSQAEANVAVPRALVAEDDGEGSPAEG